jgi:hypothetical protein
MITEKLVGEALECPIAMTELVKQYSELSTEDRQVWLTTIGATEAYGVASSLITMDSGIGSVLMLLLGYDPDAGILMVGDIYNFVQASDVADQDSPATFEEFRAQLGL